MRAPSDVIVIATAKAKPGKEAALERALREVAGPTRAQPGCVQFSLYRSTIDSSTMIGFERWASKSEHQRHLEGAHVQTLLNHMATILAEPPGIVSYEILDD
jgi:quinol monooxygenase YgiN